MPVTDRERSASIGAADTDGPVQFPAASPRPAPTPGRAARKGGTQATLRAAVTQLLRGECEARVAEVNAAVKERAVQTDELLQFSPHDATHLWWEEITATAFLLREVEAAALPDEVLAEVLDLL